MYRVIDVGDKQVPMNANAATVIRYRQVFGKNLLEYFSGESTNAEASEMLGELAYIMAKSASGADMNKLSYDDYIAWLCDFEPLDFINAMNDIIALYTANQRGDSIVKKNQDLLSENLQ